MHSDSVWVKQKIGNEENERGKFAIIKIFTDHYHRNCLYGISEDDDTESKQKEKKLTEIKERN